MSSSNNPNSKSDQSQRILALDSSKSFIVRAPAGSGKTSTLSQRFLKLLAMVDRPEEIIAITFTKKAAKEMRDRIISELKKADEISFLGSDEQKKRLVSFSDFDKFNLSLAQSALEQNNTKNWKLLDNPANLKIKTIDAYIQDLLYQLPSSVSNQEIIENIEPLATQAVLKMLELVPKNPKLATAYQTILPLFSYNYQSVNNSLISLLSRREQWLSLKQSSHQSANLKKIIKNEIIKLQLILEKAAKECDEKFNTTGTFEAINEAYKITRCFLEKIPFDDKEIKTIDLFNKQNKTYQHLVDYQKMVARLFLTQGDALRKKTTRREGLPKAITTKERGQTKLDKDWVTDIYNKITNLLLINKENQKLIEQLKSVQNLPTQIKNDANIEAIFILLRHASAELELILGQNQKIDFSSLLLQVIDALGDEENPTDLSLYLDYQIKHLLIDEFQDVSKLQVELIKRLTAGWDESTKDKTLFLVGDPMQSIYRFRQADVYYFNQIEQEQKLVNLPIIPLSLSVNFRSEQKIIMTNNQIFDHLDGNDLFGSVRFEPSGTSNSTDTRKDDNSQKVGFHCLYPIKKATGMYKTNQDEMITQVIKQIKKLQKAKEKNIAVLFPKRTHSKNLIQALKENQIKTQENKLIKLNNQIEIHDLNSLTSSIFDCSDIYAWMSLFRSKFCALAIDDLLEIRKFFETEPLTNIFVTIKKLAKQQFEPIKITANGKRNLGFLIEVLNPIIESKYPLAKKLELATKELNTYSKEKSLKNMEQFLLLLNQIAPTNALEFGNFQAQLKQLTSHNSGIDLNAIQLMTIHGAKGLEFDHVIIWGLDSLKKNSGKNNPVMLWDIIQGYPIIGLKKQTEVGSKTQEKNAFDWLNFLKKEKETNEKKRVTYVALTRAKKSNFIVFLTPTPKKTNEIDLLNLRIIDNSFRKQYETTTLMSESTLDKIDKLINDSSEFRNIQKFDLTRQLDLAKLSKKLKSKNLDRPIYYWAAMESRAAGIVSHLILEKIANIGINNLGTAAINQLIKEIPYQTKKANFGLSSEKIQNIVLKIIKNITKCKYAKFIFANHNQAQNEFKITYTQNNEIKNAIIDRTFVDNNCSRWIVDYKTSSHSGANLADFLQEEKQRYENQLNTYAQLVSEIYKDDTIELMLYFPLLKEKIHWQWNKPAQNTGR